MRALVGAGAGLIELGVPFSGPMAEGLVIQRAHERALARRVGVDQVLGMAEEFRVSDVRTPVVLVGYADSLLRADPAGFARASYRACRPRPFVPPVAQGRHRRGPPGPGGSARQAWRRCADAPRANVPKGVWSKCPGYPSARGRCQLD